MLKQGHGQATQGLNREYQVVLQAEGLECGEPDVGDVLNDLWLLVAA